MLLATLHWNLCPIASSLYIVQEMAQKSHIVLRDAVWLWIIYIVIYGHLQRELQEKPGFAPEANDMLLWRPRRVAPFFQLLDS